MKKIYIIHGWTYTIEPWQKTVELLKYRGVEVVQLRVPGLTADSSDVWTIQGYVDWLDEQLRGEEQPVVLGHSNGGRIALNYLVQHPGRFAQLILLNSAGVYAHPANVSLKRRVFRVLSKTLAPLKHVPYVKRIVYRLLRSDYNAAPPHMKKTLHNMLESDKALQIEAVTTPTALLWGKNDTVTPPAMGRKMNELLPDSYLKEFDGWNHAPYIDHPEQLAEEIYLIMERA